MLSLSRLNVFNLQETTAFIEETINFPLSNNNKPLIAELQSKKNIENIKK